MWRRDDSMVTPFIELIYGELLYSMLGMITPRLRAISFACRENQDVRLRFIVENLSQVDHEVILDIVQEFEAYHADTLNIQYEVVESQESLEMLDHLPHLVFAKY
jgi:hypothetical protein